MSKTAPTRRPFRFLTMLAAVPGEFAGRAGFEVFPKVLDLAPNHRRHLFAPRRRSSKATIWEVALWPRSPERALAGLFCILLAFTGRG